MCIRDRYCDVNEQILLCRKHHIKLSDAELEVPALIHARLGAYFAEYEYGITDSEILDAITYHTTGRPDVYKRQEHAPSVIKKQMVLDVTEAPYPQAPVVPFIKATQDRVVLEIQRGCIQMCIRDRFWIS